MLKELMVIFASMTLSRSVQYFPAEVTKKYPNFGDFLLDLNSRFVEQVSPNILGGSFRVDNW